MPAVEGPVRIPLSGYKRDMAIISLYIQLEFTIHRHQIRDSAKFPRGKAPFNIFLAGFTSYYM